MKKSLLLLGSILAGLLLAGCTSLEVTPVPETSNIGTVKIIENPKVKVSDFLFVMTTCLGQQGIASAVERPDYCPLKDEYVIRYKALRSWDFAPYLSDADILVQKNSMLVGYGKYHHIGGSASFSFCKWNSTRSKMEPLYLELFRNVKHQTPAQKPSAH